MQEGGGGDASSHTTRLGLGTHPRLFQIASTFPHSSRLALREVEEVKRWRVGGGGGECSLSFGPS